MLYLPEQNRYWLLPVLLYKSGRLYLCDGINGTSVHVVHVGDAGKDGGSLFAFVLTVLGDAVMTQAADMRCDGCGERDALIGQITACCQLVRIRTLGRFI